MSAIERWASAPPELSEESMDRLYERCKRLAKADFLPKQLRGKPDNVMAIALTAADLGMPTTLTTLKKFHIIDGEVVESVQVLLGLAASRGHDIWVDYQDEDRAVVLGKRAGNQRVERFEFTRERAGTAGLLDHWYEEWYDSGTGNRKRKWVIKEGETPPAWVTRDGSKAVKKRNEYWWGWPVEAVTNAAVRRAVRAICPDVLLGLPSAIHDFAGPAGADETSSGGAHGAPPDVADGAHPSAAPAGEPSDDDIVDGEIVEDENATSEGGDDGAAAEAMPGDTTADPGEVQDQTTPAGTEPEPPSTAKEQGDEGSPAVAAPGGPAPPSIVGDEWRKTFAIVCNEAGLDADQRHAIISYATRGRTQTSKELRTDEVGDVRIWFRAVTEGSPPPYRFLELDGAVVIAPRSPEGGPGGDQLPLEDGDQAA